MKDATDGIGEQLLVVDRAIIAGLREDPGSRLEQSAVQLQNVPSTLGDIRRSRSNRSKSTPEGPLEQIVQVCRQHRAQLRFERRERAKDRRELLDVSVIQRFQYDRDEISRADR